MTTRQVFRGRTLTEARRAAVEALGGGAVLLTTREVRQPGIAGLLGTTEVEVVATVPEATPAASAPAPKRTPPLFALGAYAPGDPAAESTAPAVPAAPAAPPGPSMGSIRNELRTELRAIKTVIAQAERVPPVVMAELAALRTALEEVALEPATGDRAVALLRARGIEGPAASTLARLLRREDEGTLPDRLREALAEVISVAPWPLADQGRSLIAMVGPTGVGKTTTIAKLAARARMDRRSVTLISCDGFRVGAIEQLRRYASLMDAEFDTANTAEELARSIEAADTDVVLIDTAGSPPKSGGVEMLLAAEDFARIATSRNLTRHVLLCLPAALRAQDAQTMAHTYAGVGPTALVITKLDETSAPSGLVHGPAASGLPVSVLCAGQRVPEHVAPATAGAILDHLVPRSPGASA